MEAVPQKQLLIIEPANELEFCGPFTQPHTSTIKLTNPTKDRITYKVKTTVPKRYCVRPSSGVVEPSSSADVVVMLQPFDYQPAEKNKHKFMIQSMVYEDDSNVSLEQFWKDAPVANMSDTRLKCILRPLEDLLKIDKSVLIFEESKCSISATNTSPQHVCFKVKTNQPRRYTVSPNEGIIKAHDTQVIDVYAVPDIDSAGESKDILVIMSTVCPDETPSSLDQIWLMVDKTKIFEKQIVCTSALGKQTVSNSPPDEKHLSREIEQLKRENARLRQSGASISHDDKHTSGELDYLRKENALLKTELARNRRIGLDNAPMTSGQPSGSAGLMRLDMIPPMVYLLVTFLIALFVGKYVL